MLEREMQATCQRCHGSGQATVATKIAKVTMPCTCAAGRQVAVNAVRSSSWWFNR